MKKFFTEIIGNDKLKSRLGKDIMAGTLSHACILEGARGTGRHTVARMCAAALACTERADREKPLPCLECNACRKVLEGKSPDLIFVNKSDKATLGVDVIRELRTDVYTVPNDLDYKIYVIEEADKMTVQAQNALLLTLEEPPEYVRFFLLCENAGLLLETIRSRAPVIRTEPVDTELIEQYVCTHDRRAAQMKLSAPRDFSELLKASGHGIGSALEYLDSKTFAPILERRRLVRSFLDAALRRDTRAVLSMMSSFSAKRDLLNTELSTLSDAVRDLILLKKSDRSPLVFFVHRDDALELCDRVSLQFLFKLWECVRSALDANARNANVRLLLLKMASDADII